jgi:hypothetical protein
MLVRHSVAQPLDLAAARLLVERAFAHYRDRYPAYRLKLGWPTPQQAELALTARGRQLTARLALAVNQATVELDVPLVFWPFQAAACRAIDREVDRWLKSPPDA